MKKKNNHHNKILVEKRPVEVYFAQLDSVFVSGNKFLYALFLTLIFFGVMGLIWMIPFPQFQFLVDRNMHTFLNWGSIFIAVVIYSYLKLAPTLSYIALMCISVMSFFIVQLEYVQRDGGPAVVLVCAVLSIVGLIGLYANSKSEKNVNFGNLLQFLAIGPIWLWSKVYEKLKIKY